MTNLSGRVVIYTVNTFSKNKKYSKNGIFTTSVFEYFIQIITYKIVQLTPIRRNPKQSFFGYKNK